MDKNINYRSVQSNQIYLNSSTADIYLNNSMKSNVVFFFKEPMKLERNSLEMRVSLVNAQVPISYYNINATNNQFYISGILYSFPIGNYNVDSFMKTWMTLFVGWTLTYNNITNKLTFHYTNDFTISDSGKSLFPIIGFTQGKTYNSFNSSLLSDNVCNFFGVTRLHVKSNTFSLKNVDSRNKGRNRTLGVIPVNGASSSMILYNNFTNFTTPFKNREISVLNIEIQDDAKNYIDFQNQDWTMTLQIDILSEYFENIDDMADLYNNLVQELG